MLKDSPYCARYDRYRLLRLLRAFRLCSRSARKVCSQSSQPTGWGVGINNKISNRVAALLRDDRISHSVDSERDCVAADAKEGTGSSNWYPIYYAAMLENSRDKALCRIARAKKAIQDRLEQLRSAPSAHPRETRDLDNAWNYLGILLHNAGTEDGRILWD